MTNIRTQPPPNLIGQPKVDLFIKEDFNAALWENGYDVTLEEAVACPCKGSSSAAKSTCSNCFGSGWVFINPIKTKAFITSINRNTKYKDWSPEFIGTSAMTFMNVNRIGFMDKVTIDKNYGLMSEVLPARINSTEGYSNFIFCTYRVLDIKSIFVFNGDNAPLIKLPASDYRVNPTNNYVIDIKDSVLPIDFNGKVSISYKHYSTYNILDIPHDLRITKEYNQSGKRVTEDMPVHAVARKSQYELGSATNYEGNNIQNNNYL